MAKKKLTLKGITFPDFGDDDSKKNFRLIFYIAFTGPNGDETAAIVSKPDAGAWQWRKESKDFYLPAAIKGDSAELDTKILKTGGSGFAPASDKIVEIDGEITAITVQFLDVFDSSVGDFLKSRVLPDVIKQLRALGIDPIDLIPVPGVFTAVIKDRIRIDELAGKVQEVLTGKKKDKLLHTVSKDYDGEKTLTIKEKKEWDAKKHLKGTYGVKLAIK